jgi:hypothetical protein
MHDFFSRADPLTKRQVSSAKEKGIDGLAALTKIGPEDVSSLQGSLRALIGMCYHRNASEQRTMLADEGDAVWKVEPMIDPANDNVERGNQLKKFNFERKPPKRRSSSRKDYSGCEEDVESPTRKKSRDEDEEYHGELDGPKKESKGIHKQTKRLLGTFATSIDQTKDAVTRQKAKSAIRGCKDLQVLTTYAVECPKEIPECAFFLVCWDGVNTHPYSRADSQKMRDRYKVHVLIPPVAEDVDAELELGKKLAYLGKMMKEKKRDRYMVSTDCTEYYESIYGKDGEAPQKLKSNDEVKKAYSSNMLASGSTPSRTPLTSKSSVKGGSRSTSKHQNP